MNFKPTKEQLAYNANNDLNVINILINLNDELFNNVGNSIKTKKVLKELQKTIPHSREALEDLSNLINLTLK